MICIQCNEDRGEITPSGRCVPCVQSEQRLSSEEWAWMQSTHPELKSLWFAGLTDEVIGLVKVETSESESYQWCPCFYRAGEWQARILAEDGSYQILGWICELPNLDDPLTLEATLAEALWTKKL